MPPRSDAVPAAELAIIGGSSTNAIVFPEEAGVDGVAVIDENLVFSTPFGYSPPLKLFTLPKGQSVLTCRMHGWRPGVSRRDASLQLFQIFREAGVREVIAEGGVGSITPSFSPGDLFIPDDYLDWSCRRDASLSDDYLLIMRDPCCLSLRRRLAAAAAATAPDTSLHHGGVYAVTDGRHFESRAEVRALAALGADAVGQSLAPEVYLAREIGACYAGLHQVVNRAEGVGRDWSHDELRDLYHGGARRVARILLDAAVRPGAGRCPCRSLRRETILGPPEDAPAT